MEQIMLIVLGWLLGMLSPAVVGKIAQSYRKDRLFNAMKAELEDFKYRLVLAHILLTQRHCEINKEYLNWVRPYISGYKGNIETKPVLTMIDTMLQASDAMFTTLLAAFQAEKGQGMILKQYKLSLLDSNIEKISIFPISVQTKIHELVNQINIINQDAKSNNEYFNMTFDSSISVANHRRLIANIDAQYKYLLGVYKNAILRVDAILIEKI